VPPKHYSSRHQIACFKVTTKSYNVATRTAEPRRMKAAQNSHRSNAVLLTWSRAVMVVKSFRGLETYNLVTATIVSTYKTTRYHNPKYYVDIFTAMKTSNLRQSKKKNRVFKKEVYTLKNLFLQALLNIWRRAIYRLK
jgi:hypothetical protein